MTVALELIGGRVVARPSPRLVTGAIVAGVVTVDCALAQNVIVTLSLTADVASVVYQNLPTVCSVRWRVTQSGGPWAFPAAAHQVGTTVDGIYYLYPDATLTRMWWETFDGGATATLETNAPGSGATGDAYATSHEADSTAHPASSIVNTPAGNIAATTVQSAINELDSEKSATGHTHAGVYEPAGEAAAAVSTHAAATTTHGISAFGASLVDDADASAARTTLGLDTAATAAIDDFAPVSEGVTNGNNHDHNGGDGAQIGTGGLANNVVTNAKLATMGAGTLKGRSNTTTGDPEDISAAAARALIESVAPSIVTISGATTLIKADHQGKLLYCVAGATTLTVNASTDFDAYASCEIVNKSGGAVTFVATATINRIGSKPLTLPANGRATLMREATADVYLLTGEMA